MCVSCLLGFHPLKLNLMDCFFWVVGGQEQHKQVNALRFHVLCYQLQLFETFWAALFHGHPQPLQLTPAYPQSAAKGSAIKGVLAVLTNTNERK